MSVSRLSTTLSLQRIGTSQLTSFEERTKETKLLMNCTWHTSKTNLPNCISMIMDGGTVQTFWMWVKKTTSGAM